MAHDVRNGVTISPYRAAAPVPDVVRVRHLRAGDRIPTERLSALLRWYCIDLSDDEASYLGRCAVCFGLSKATHAMRRHIEVWLPGIRGRHVDTEELSWGETRALPPVTCPAFGLYNA